MTAPQVDYGKNEIKAFNDAVAAGVLQFDEHAAKEAERLYELMIDGLRKIKTKLVPLTHTTGFGGFQSAVELQQGFSKKATDGLAVLDELLDAAMQLQEAYLRAGRQLDEADRINANRMKFLAEAAGTDRTGS